MRKWYAVAAMVTAGAFAAACSDSPTGTAKNAAKAPSHASGTVVNGAAFTTTDPAVDRPGGVDGGTPTLCRNGQDLQAGTNNCNIYASKSYVWLNGGPAAAQVGGAGDYFFAVLIPSGQGSNDNPNDGTIGNLSDFTPNPTTNTGAGDAYTNRTFHVDGSGVVTYSGTHTFDAASGNIRLMGYDNTTNPGGEYILAVCTLSNGYPVSPSDCKYDAFKVKASVPPEVQALTASVSIAPNGTNGIGEQHVFTVSYSVSGGTRPYYINVTPAVTPAPSSFATTCPNDPVNPLVTSGGTGTYSNTCTVTINSNVAGVFVASAQIDVVDSGSPQQQASDNTGALGGSGNATKTYVAGTLSWTKTSNYPGGLLAGATFQIQRIADRFGVALSPADAAITGITDCTASPCLGTDKDPVGGQFRVEGLVLGTYRITETAAPALYDLASPVYQDVALTLASPSGSAAFSFVDPLHLFGETATVQGFPWSATRGAPSTWFMYAPWVTTSGQTGLYPGPANLIAGQHYVAGSVQGSFLGTQRRITVSLVSGFSFASTINNVKIQPLSTCSANQNYVQPGQFSIKSTASGSSITVNVPAAVCYGVHVDVLRNPILFP